MVTPEEASTKRKLYDFIKSEGKSYGVWFHEIEDTFGDVNPEHLEYLIEEGFIIERRPLLFVAINNSATILSNVEKLL